MSNPCDKQRRGADKTLCSIKEQIDENSQEIRDLHASLSFHVQRQDESLTKLMSSTQVIHDKVDPVFATLEDIAAVGRIAGRVKNVVVWCTAVCGSIALAWQWATHFRIK